MQDEPVFIVYLARACGNNARPRILCRCTEAFIPMNRIAAIFPTADAVTLGPLAALFADNPRLPVQMLAFCAVFLYFFLFWL